MIAEPRVVVCNNGFITLPDEIYETLRSAAPNGIVYVREDQDVVTISIGKLKDARRRQLHHRYRIRALRDAARVAIIELPDGVQLMPAEWRTARLARREES
ncbi:MAG TPA: hypothetical protein VIL97_00200 [Thermoanaerobaculia bacterium]